jgi:hypothetical protein
MVVARDGSPKFLKSKILRDDGCPTCGSMDYGVLEIKNSQNMIDKKLQCYNCKKFWYIKS